MQAPARREGSRGVARIFRSAILGLQQIYVAAPGDIERMALRADQASLIAHQWLVAMANGAEEQAGTRRLLGRSILRWPPAGFRAFVGQEFDDGFITEPSCGIKRGAAVGVRCIDIDMLLDSELDRLKHKSFAFAALQRHPSLASAHS